MALRLTGTVRLSDALNQLYVLLPVLDDAKHYWVGSDEVDKLIRAGAGWLAAHPERDLIVARYLRRRGVLARAALAALAESEGVDPDSIDDADAAPVVADDRPVPLAVQRRDTVLALLREIGARRVGDLGCGDGALLGALIEDPAFEQIIGADVSVRSLETAARRLRLDTMAERRRERLTLMQSSLTYRDDRLAGLDAAVLMEVVEHIDPPRLAAVERNMFGFAAPGTVIVTTPNIEHNVRFPNLPAGDFRHRDHRFEWTRAEFAAWSARVARAYGYRVRYVGIGADDPEVGPPTQAAVFERESR